MSITVALRHKTQYSFDRPVELSPHVIRLRPAAHSRTPIEAYTLKILPEDHFINWQQDPFGNYLARVVFQKKVKELIIDVEVIARLESINPFDFFLEEYAEHYPFQYPAQLKRELHPYFEIMEQSPLLQTWLETTPVVKELFHKKDLRTPTTPFLVSLNQKLCEDIAYSIRMEPGVQSCETTLQKKLGSCRDTAFLLVQILRHLGLAARFVSGYLVQLTPDVKALDGPIGTVKDFTDLHAWAEVYIPGAGWIGLDPTSGLLTAEGHIPLACTPDAISAAPITGAIINTGDKPCKTDFDFSNEVHRIVENPRVTKPYSENQWQSIYDLGNVVDKILKDSDVRLTMGGEPTFVSIDDMEAEEWNTAADGPHKRQLAHDLFLKMQKHFAPNGVVHYGQGKWYPGEPLPRWQYACFWRKDSQPLWNNHELLANPYPGKKTESNAKKYTLQDTLKFMQAVAQKLTIKNDCIHPAFEDTFYIMWQEGNVPADINLEQDDKKELDLNTTNDRQSLLAKLSGDLHQATGYVLPIAKDPKSKKWISDHWQFRRKKLYLIPGDAPLGLRLPLQQIQMPSVAVHTALCVEIRNEFLQVFLPPVESANEYYELLNALEYAAEKLKYAIIIEGYEPPKKTALECFKVTPDPGVVEVNIHPASSWQQLVDNTQVLYQLARENRLGTEKFAIDGRHTGTGGGHHITLGGATPEDSPLLRRPDVLRSLITFWQHHPGLSYLFSGLFIGPTSQAPRVDEARDSAIYELEIALSNIPHGEVVQPWLVDRILRNILVDLSGNTHRAEFCIDKLFSPDSATGRLGILELRAFEMPPHAHMSLVQMLLLRTLIAIFWHKPYHHNLIRWNTQLHDRFMLPHFVWQDVAEVCEFILSTGYTFSLEWLAPFYEFRFPIYGASRVQNMAMELRMAIEP
ncbi:MAG: transglutaminase family protein, partial [Pseudomonadota bacterium]